MIIYRHKADPQSRYQIVEGFVNHLIKRDGVWLEAVVYRAVIVSQGTVSQDSSKPFLYARTREDFDENFEPISEWKL